MSENVREAAVRGNFLEEAEFKRRAAAAVSKIADVLSCTLGPMGSNVFIEDQFLQHTVTKDGYTVVSKMGMADPVEKCVLNYIQKVSARLNMAVGDGTTTAVVVAAEMFKELEALKERSGADDRMVARAVEEAVAEVTRRLSEAAIPVSQLEDFWGVIGSVASVAANNDARIGELVAEAMEKVSVDGALTARPSHGEDTVAVYSSGIEVERGMVLPVMINDPENRCFEAAGNVVVFMSREPLGGQHVMDFSRVLQSVCVVGHAALVVAAPGYDDRFLNFLMENKIRNKEALPVVAFDMATRSLAAQDRFGDLAAYTGCRPWGSEAAAGYPSFNAYCTQPLGSEQCPFGSVHDVKVTEKRSVLVGARDPEACRARVAELKAKLEALQSSACEARDTAEEETALRMRIRSLSEHGVATILVGGDSDQEKKAKTYLVEDAICAARSAARHGVLPGCCLQTINSIAEARKLLPGISPAEQLPEDRRSYFVTETGKEILRGMVLEAFHRAYVAVLRRTTRNSGGGGILMSYDVERTVPNLVTGVSGHFSTNRYPNIPFTDLLTSAESDVRIMRTAASIAALLTTSRAFLSWNTVFNGEK